MRISNKIIDVKYEDPRIWVSISNATTDHEEGRILAVGIYNDQHWIFFPFESLSDVIESLGKLIEMSTFKGEQKIELDNDIILRRIKPQKYQYDEFDYQIEYEQGTILKKNHTAKQSLRALKELKERYESYQKVQENLKKLGELYVEVNGKKIFPNQNGTLQLNGLGIKKISDVKGLEKFKYLQRLALHNNEIEEIEGLDHLKHLRYLSLSINQIKEIKGLENLINLEELILNTNPIEDPKGLGHFTQLTRIDLSKTLIPDKIFRKAKVNNPEMAQGIVKYARAQAEQEKQRQEKIKNTIDFLKKASVLFQELSFKKIMEKTKIELRDLEKILEDLILNGEIYAKIKRDGILYLDEKEMEGIDQLLGAYKDWEDKQHDKKDK